MGLRSYAEGFVKEGAGAGGTTIAAHLKDPSLTKATFMHELERNYSTTIEKPLL
jgi:NaMN:DMB phosphoribosyltransferase